MGLYCDFENPSLDFRPLHEESSSPTNITQPFSRYPNKPGPNLETEKSFKKSPDRKHPLQKRGYDNAVPRPETRETCPSHTLFEGLRAGRFKPYSASPMPLFVTCAFRHEETPDNNMVELEAKGRSARVCPRCLILITVHRRYHHMNLESLIPQMAD